MDEMRIASEFMQGIIAKVVSKIMTKKLGVGLNLKFNDPIFVKFDGDQAIVNLNVMAKMSKDDLSKLLKDLV